MRAILRFFRFRGDHLRVHEVDPLTIYSSDYQFLLPSI